MAREVRTERRGSHPFVVILIFVLGIALVVVVFYIVKLFDPSFLPEFFGTPDQAQAAQLAQQNQELTAENGNLSSELNDTETQNGDLRAQLMADRDQGLIPIVIIIGIVVLVAFFLYMRFRNQKDRPLDIDEAEAYELPRARALQGFPEDYYPAVKVTKRGFERLKQTGDLDRSEFMYFIEFQFLRAGEQNQFWQGVHGHRSNTVTVALTNRTYRYREQWFDWLRIDEAIKRAHELELWGFALQKTKLEEDFTSAIENVRSFNELRKQYAVEDSGVEE